MKLKKAGDFIFGGDIEIKNKLSFGINYLDDSTGGIFPNDVIVIGARTGCGKTALASHIAMHNALNGKHVAFFALEAENAEIERRIEFTKIAKEYYNETKKRIYFRDFINGNLPLDLEPIRKRNKTSFIKLSLYLDIFYRTGGKYDKNDLRSDISNIAKGSLELNETDLIIIDHLQYVDIEGNDLLNETKLLIKTIRDLALLHDKPIIVLSHLRKRTGGVQTLVPDEDEFFGSSDVIKIATKVISIAPHYPSKESKTLFPTLFKICKNRSDSSPKFYIGMHNYDVVENKYEEKYLLSDVQECTKGFEPYINFNDKIPYWAKEENLKWH